MDESVDRPSTLIWLGLRRSGPSPLPTAPSHPCSRKRSAAVRGEVGVGEEGRVEEVVPEGDRDQWDPDWVRRFRGLWLIGGSGRRDEAEQGLRREVGLAGWGGGSVAGDGAGARRSGRRVSRGGACGAGLPGLRGGAPRASLGCHLLRLGLPCRGLASAPPRGRSRGRRVSGPCELHRP